MDKVHKHTWLSRWIYYSLPSCALTPIATMSPSEAEQGALTAKNVAYIRKRDPTDYATKDEREAEQDFLAPASLPTTK